MAGDISIDNAKIILKEQSNTLCFQCQFKQEKQAYFSWIIDSFNGSFQSMDHGLGQSEHSLFLLKKGHYRARLNLSYKMNTRGLEQRFNVDDAGNISLTTALEKTISASPELPAFPDFIAEMAQTFARSKSQDSVHNPVLNYLLQTTYGAENIAADDPNAAAYTAVRGSSAKTSHPLYWIRGRTQLAKVRNSRFFIRDFMQLQGLGGEDKHLPLIIGDPHSKGKQRQGLVISDGVLQSNFADDFNKIIAQINQMECVKKLPYDVAAYKGIAHRDAIQLIPISKDISQLAGMTMKHVLINGNKIYSDAALQGIFASDGTFQDLTISNNSLQVGGTHTISINGLLSGTIDNNTDLKNQLLTKDKITLYPLRIGGGANIYVMSFKNPQGLQAGDANYYAYEKIQGSQAITDLRHVKPQKYGASYWKNVDLPALQTRFQATFECVKQSQRNKASRQEIQVLWTKMMMQVGELDQEETTKHVC